MQLVETINAGTWTFGPPDGGWASVTFSFRCRSISLYQPGREGKGREGDGFRLELMPHLQMLLTCWTGANTMHVDRKSPTGGPTRNGPGGRARVSVSHRKDFRCHIVRKLTQIYNQLGPN